MAVSGPSSSSFKNVGPAFARFLLSTVVASVVVVSVVVVLAGVPNGKRPVWSPSFSSSRSQLSVHSQQIDQANDDQPVQASAVDDESAYEELEVGNAGEAATPVEVTAVNADSDDGSSDLSASSPLPMPVDQTGSAGSSGASPGKSLRSVNLLAVGATIALLGVRLGGRIVRTRRMRS